MDVEKQALESQARQLFAGAVWSHKIQEKESDILLNRYRFLEFVKIATSAITFSGIIAAFSFGIRWVQGATAICSASSLFASIYCDTNDFKQMSKEHKATALRFLSVREDFVVLLRKIRYADLPVDELEGLFQETLKLYSEAAATMGETSSGAFKKASKALNTFKDYTYTEEEIDAFLPPELKRKATSGLTNPKLTGSGS